MYILHLQCVVDTVDGSLANNVMTRSWYTIFERCAAFEKAGHEGNG